MMAAWRGTEVKTLRLPLGCLLAAAVGTCGPAAGEQLHPFQAADLRPPRSEKPEPSLSDRCRKMLDMQAAVYKGTRDLHKAVQGAPDRKPRPEDRQVARKLAAGEEAVAAQATKVIETLQTAKAAPAFGEVFQESRKDAESVRLRLEACDVGLDTQALERDVIETLRDMLASLKKG
jgi:hypothetical protein